MEFPNTLLDQFEAFAKTLPNNCAIIYHDAEITRFTYVDINNAIILISNLIKRYTNKSQCIGVITEENYILPSLVFSVMKSNSSFTLIDAMQSKKINVNLVNNLQLKWLLCYADDNNKSINCLLTELGCKLRGNVHVFEPKRLKQVQLWETNFANKHDFNNICYVIQTSGTTGEAKTVRVKNECIASNVNCLRTIFKITSKDIIYLSTPVTFDPIFIEIFVALCSGATLKIVASSIRLNSNLLLNVLFPKNEKGITFMQMPPSLFLRWSEESISEVILSATSSLRILVIGGESFNNDILKFNQSKSVEIYNIYGITEVSCWASVAKVNDCSDKICLGLPLNDTSLQVINSNGDVIDSGKGELFIGSHIRICLLNDEIESELPSPVYRATGDIVEKYNSKIFYVCRKNDVFKRYGHKVSLITVENVVRTELQLQCSCVYLENVSKLILFVVIRDFMQETAAKIKDKIRVKLLNALERHLMPDIIEILPKIPLTSNGKIDKKCLREIFLNTNNDFNVENLQPDCLLSNLWSKFLGLSDSELSRHKDRNFFEMGGNSITVLQIVDEFKALTKCDDFDNVLATFLNGNSYEECIDACKSFNFKARKKHKLDDAASGTSYENKMRFHESTEKINVHVKWKYNMDACVDATPNVFTLDTGTYVTIGSFSHKFALLNAENGTEMFTINLSNAMESSCCLSNCKGRIFFGCFDGLLYCIDSTNGATIWTYKTNSRIKSTPCLVLNGVGIIVGSYDKHVHCVNCETGEIIWKTDVQGSVTSSPVYSSCLRLIFVATLRGTCLCLSENDGKVVWKRDVGYPVFGSPSFICSDSVIMWPDVQGSLHSFSANNGQLIWNYEAHGYVYSSLFAHNNKILFGCQDKSIYCLHVDEKKCSFMYKTELDAIVSTTPCVFTSRKTGTTDVIVANTNGGKIFFINFQLGTVLNYFDLESETFSSVIFYDYKLYVGCRDNYLYCLGVE